jgi:hypothetical protein
MKLIVCPSCGAEAIGPVTERFPRGTPYIVRKWTSKQYPLITKCRRCFQPIRMTAIEFNRLPDMTEEQIQKHDMHAHRDMSPQELKEKKERPRGSPHSPPNVEEG